MIQFVDLRLDSLQQKALIAALAEIKDPVYIFGSRTDLLKKGGDVDILIVSDFYYQSHFNTTLQVIKKYQLICDEKIDVIIYPSPQNMDPVQRDFFNHISKKRLQ